MPQESHRSEHINWLRAAVLGANDGIVSTASLIVGVSAAHASHSGILVSGVAGLVAGAMSMAAGEYVSVSTQRDTEHADLNRERDELAANIDLEREELAQIYVARGLDEALARQVAEQLMARDALGAHAREELGILNTESLRARPLQAALASAASFAGGAALPLAIALVVPQGSSGSSGPIESPGVLISIVSLASLVFLVLLGFSAAKFGGAKPWKGALRVGFWGALAMALTAGIGAMIG